MTRSEDTDTATRRGFLRSATAGAAAVSAGVAGASASASAQSENGTDGGPMGNGTDDGTGEGNETGGHSEEGGQFVLTDSILMMVGFIVVGVLSPLAFAVFLARRYRGDTPE